MTRDVLRDHFMGGPGLVPQSPARRENSVLNGACLSFDNGLSSSSLRASYVNTCLSSINVGVKTNLTCWEEKDYLFDDTSKTLFNQWLLGKGNGLK